MTNTNTDYHDVLNNIQRLQSIEKQLHSELRALPPTAGVERQQLIVNKINNVSNHKISLFKNLMSSNALLQEDIASGNAELKARQQMAQAVEGQLDASREQMAEEQARNFNNMRLTKINTYYSDKYRAYTTVFSYVVLMCVALIIVALLRQRYIIEARVANILGAIVIIVALFFVLPKLWSISSRNNMVFDEYDFGSMDGQEAGDDGNVDANAGMNDTTITINTTIDKKNKYEDKLQRLASGECIGAACCTLGGLEYSKEKQECIKAVNGTNTTTEPMIPGRLTSQSVYVTYPGAKLNENKNLVVDPNAHFYSLN